MILLLSPFIMVIDQVTIIILLDQGIIAMIPYYPTLFSLGKRERVGMADLPTGLALSVIISILICAVIIYWIICLLIRITLNSLNNKLRFNQEHSFTTAPRSMISTNDSSLWFFYPSSYRENLCITNKQCIKVEM